MKMTTRSRRQALLASTSALMIVMSASVAHAQTLEIPLPPRNSMIDERGVDLASSQLMVNLTPLTIGDGNNGLKHSLYYPGLYGFRHDQMITATADDYDMYGNAAGYHITIAFGQNNNGFTWNGSSYVPDKADGSTLVGQGTKWVYTNRDGVVIDLDRTHGPFYQSYYNTTNYYGGVDGIATSITNPDGFKTRLTYKSGTFFYSDPYGSGNIQVTRLQSATTSSGFQIKYNYKSNSLSQSSANDWLQFSQVSGLNNAIDYCDPAADICSGLTQSWPTVTYGSSASGSNGILSITDPVGRTSSFTFDSLGRIAGSKLPTWGVDSTVYGYNGNSTSISSVTIHNIGTWNYSFSYDPGSNVLSGTVATPTIPIPRSFSSSYALRQPYTMGDENGRVTKYTYDAAGHVLTKELDGAGSNYEAYSYDARGNLTSVVANPKAGSGFGTLTTSASYPVACATLATCNKPTSTTNSDNQVTNYYYNGNGTIDYIQLPAPTPGAPRPETHYSYVNLQSWLKDGAGNVVVGPDVISTQYAATSCVVGSWPCAPANQVVKEKMIFGGPTVTNLQVESDIVRSGDASQYSRTRYTYDKVGNLASIMDPMGNVTDMGYFADRQPYWTLSPPADGSATGLRRETIHHYNADGLRDSTSFGTYNPTNGAFTANRIEYFGYDSQGRKTLDGLSDGSTTYAMTQYSYNGANRLECKATRMNPSAFGSLPVSACNLGTQGNSGPDRITHYSYEYAGLLAIATSGYGTSVQRDDVRYIRTNHDLVNAIIDGKGNTTNYVYDAHDRLVRTCYNAAPGSCDADTASDFVQLTYDAAGRLSNRGLRGHSTAITIGYAYDKLGRVTNVNYPGGGMYDQPVSYSYDNLGRLLHAVDNGTHTAHFTYDAMGNVTGQSDSIGGRAMQYDPAGRRTRLSWQDGRYITYDYNHASDLTAIKESGTTDLVRFLYDDLGRRTRILRGNGVETVYGSYNPMGVGSISHNLPGTANDITFTFGYNAAGQITSRTSTTSNNAYTFSDYYNTNRGYTTNGLNQYTSSGSIIPSYDVKGNLASAGTGSYAYSTKNELAYKYDTATGFYHDPLGKLDAILDSTGNGIIGFQYEGDHISMEIGGASTPGFPTLRRYVYGPGADEPLVQFEGGDFSNKRYMLADERGSIIAITDAAGNPTAINSYDEYGIPAPTNQGRFQYTGQAWIPELGMYSYKARVYSPTLGRFLQPDPAGYRDGPNWYNYTLSDPINGIDPSGLGCISFQGGCVDDGFGDIVVHGSRSGGGLSGFFNAYNSLASQFAAWEAWMNQQVRSANIQSAQIAGGRQKNDLPPCNAVQRGGQALGKFAVDIGGGVSDVGLVVGGAGVVAAGVSAVALNPAGVLIGGAMVIDGGTATGVGGLITAGGATLMALSGSGKEAAKELGTRILTQRFPSGPVKDWVGKGVGAMLDMLPEIKSCR